jgi:acetylornithine aminotransferase
LLPPLIINEAESDELVQRISTLVRDFLTAEGVVAA